MNTTNTGTITNLVSLSTNIVGGVTLSVSNLPAGCGYDLVTTNGSVGQSVLVTNDTALSIVVNSTNIPQGEYTFYLVGTGGATNSMPFVLQSCYIWNGLGFNTNANWTNGASWVGGNYPTTNSANDVFFGTPGAQTNRFSGIAHTNVNITQNITVGSLRFGPGTYVNTNAGFEATNALFHHVLINAGTTLAVTGARGFSLLRDYVAEYADAAESGPDRKTGVFISGAGNGARLLVSNASANVSMLLDNGGSGDSFLSMTNLHTFEANVNRIGLGDYLLYPNYRGMNMDTNGLGGVPRRFVTSVIFARTNFITAGYKDPDNYTNVNTRAYALEWLNGEMAGNGSSINNFLHFGLTNRILADSVCFVGANHSSGNGGSAGFHAGVNNCGAVFTATNGGRMTIFTVSDGGGTNDAGSNIKANINFWGGQSGNFVSILTDQFYIARDRPFIAESNTVNYEGNFVMGKGIVDANTAILGYQEHQVRLNNDTPQLGYCRGNLTVTNGGLFKVNRQLTLGYTADMNATGVSQQYNTYGRIVVSGASLIASNIIVDGGPRNYSHTEGTARGDSITLTAASMTVSNSIGNAPGQPLNSFSTERSTNVWLVAVGRTNLICRNLATPGTEASVIRVASLAGVTSLPATIPIISYETASSPYLKADMTGHGATNGYLLNNTAGGSVDLFLTTNAPRTLQWTGSVNGNWDTNTANWVLYGTGTPATFSIGDVAIFDDTSTRTNVTIVGEVVPGQSGAGITVSNNTRHYTFSGGTVAGTSSLLKTGTGPLTIGATKQGPVTVLQGALEVAVGGTVGLTTVASNTFVNCLGAINGGLTSTGAVNVAAGGTLDGPVLILDGFVNNDGTISTAPSSLTFTAGKITNSGTMNISVAAYAVNAGSVLANFGTINHLNNRINISGLVFGTGSFNDPDGGLAGPGGLISGIDGRVNVLNPTGFLSPGATPTGSIGTLTVGTRFDLSAANNNGFGTLLIEVDKSHPQTNDFIVGDFWNNFGGRIIVSNLNAGAPLVAGDTLWIFHNNNGEFYENRPDVDAAAQTTIEPPIPGPGLQWDISDLRKFGKIRVRSTPMIWRGNISSAWDTSTANWLGGIQYTNLVGAQFDDSVGSGSTNVNLTNIVAPAGYAFTTNSITTNLVGATTNFVFDITTNNSPAIPGIVFDTVTKDYTLDGTGSIEGLTGLYKTGPGTLTIGNMTNRYTGPTTIDGGVLVVSIITNVGVPNPLGMPGLGVRAPTGAERFNINGGTLRFTGNTMTSDRAMSFGLGGGTIEISNATSILTLSSPLRDGPLTKTGPGTLTLSSGNNAFTNVTVNNGLLRIAGSAAGVGHVIVNGGWLAFTNNSSITNPLNLVTSTTIDVTNNTVLGGSWLGTGDAVITNFAPSTLSISRDMSNYSGNITFVGSGTNRFNNTTNGFNGRGGAAVVFDLGASARLENFTGGTTNEPITYHLGGLAGGAGSSLAGRFSNAVTTVSSSIYSIGAKGSNTVFAGSIIDGNGGGTVSIVKVGAGMLALNGVNTYTGPTTVSNGTLAGTGTFSSALTVVPGATLAPGNSVGTMTVNNSVALNGTTIMELDRTGPVSSSDKLVANSITATGGLIVTNIGPTIANGVTFQLFSVPVSGFSSIILPGAPYVWQTNLAVNGSITLVSGGTNVVDTTPTNITSSVSGNTLTLSWPSNHTGWTLQTQTNPLSVGLTSATNTWFNVSGSSTTNSVSVTISPAQPTVFFRLVYP